MSEGLPRPARTQTTGKMQRVAGDALAGKRPPTAAAWCCRRLFLARRIRLPRRHMGSRGRVRPDRLRHPRGLRGAAEAQAPGEGTGAMLLKHRQDGGGGEGDLYMHVELHNVRILTDGSDETASTPKIVSDVTAPRPADRPTTMRPPVRRPHRESYLSGCSTSGGRGLASGASSLLAERSAALSRKPAATSGSVVAIANFKKVAACSVRYFLPGTIWFPVTTRYTTRHSRCDYALRRNPFRRKSTKVNLRQRPRRSGAARMAALRRGRLGHRKPTVSEAGQTVAGIGV